MKERMKEKGLFSPNIKIIYYEIKLNTYSSLKYDTRMAQYSPTHTHTPLYNFKISDIKQ